MNGLSSGALLRSKGRSDYLFTLYAMSTGRAALERQDRISRDIGISVKRIMASLLLDLSNARVEPFIRGIERPGSRDPAQLSAFSIASNHPSSRICGNREQLRKLRSNLRIGIIVNN